MEYTSDKLPDFAGSNIYRYASLVYNLIREDHQSQFFPRGPGPWSVDDLRFYIMLFPEEKAWLENSLKAYLDKYLHSLTIYKRLRYAKSDRERALIKLDDDVSKIDW